MQYRIGDFWVETVFELAGFAGNVDLVSVHQDFFGVPWDELLAGQPPPDFWLDRMTSLRDAVDELGVGVYLSLTPFDGMRSTLAPKPEWQGDHLETVAWTSGCFDFANPEDGTAYTAAYLAYVELMVELFEPEVLTTVIELNMYQFNCPDQWPSAVALHNAVYDRVKAGRPGLPVFPTFVLELAWGLWEGCAAMDTACLDARMAGYSALKMDRFGASDYPFHRSNETPAPPDEYYTAVAARAPAPLVFGETGYPNRPVVVPWPPGGDDCVTLLSADDGDQVRFMEQLFRLANEHRWDLVTWWSLRDFVPAPMHGVCPCSYHPIWCALSDAVEDLGLLAAWFGWGAMGILDFDLQEKPAFTTWKSWQQRPLTPILPAPRQGTRRLRP